MKLDINSLRVAAYHRHAHRGCRRHDRIIPKNLTGFIHHLHLLLRIPVIGEHIALRNAVAVDLVGVRTNAYLRAGAKAGPYRVVIPANAGISWLRQWRCRAPPGWPSR